MISIEDCPEIQQAFAIFRPRRPTPMLEWARTRICTDTGRPFDHAAYPYLGAPGGPFHAWDDPRVRTIAMQWGVRLGKTFGATCMLLKAADESPGPSMFATSREKLAKESMERLYQVIQSSRLRHLLKLPPRLQRRDLVKLAANVIYVAWAKSASTLADKNVRYGHANEIDKWEHASTSTEGDPLELFRDRFNDFYSLRKIVYESTPSIRNRSRIERLRMNGWNCALWVPCANCQRYQVLEFGDRESIHGIKWQKTGERSDVETARETAVYVCRHCAQPNSSDRRQWMIRRGVWCPEGAVVEDEAALELSLRADLKWQGWGRAEWIRGEPVRGREHASFHLPNLYALSIPTWGDYAAAFLEASKRTQSLRVFINQWLAETWESAERPGTWGDLGKAMISDLEATTVPADADLLTCGVDKQANRYVWVCEAWRPDGSSHVVAYGECAKASDLERLVLRAAWPRQGGGSVRILLGLVDSGFKPAEVYQFCRSTRDINVFPCKGSSTSLEGFFERKKLGQKSSAPGQRIFLIDTNSTQDALDRSLFPQGEGEPRKTLFRESLETHQDFLQQLLNDAPSGTLDRRNMVQENWVRVDPSMPNDFRDACRYAFAASLIARQGRLRLPPAVPVEKSIREPIAAEGESGPFLPRLNLHGHSQMPHRRGR